VLYAEGSEIIAFVEIAVSHSPEEYVYQYCKENCIPLLVIKIEKIEDVVELERNNNLLELAECSWCTATKCPKCKGPLEQRKLFVIDISCLNCKNTMKMAIGSTQFEMIHSNEFNDYDLSVAQKYDAQIKEKYRTSEGVRHLANMCKICGTFIPYYYMDKYFLEAIQSDPVNKVLWCDRCKSPIEEAGDAYKNPEKY
jgi:hypothetical protein